jgi:DNA repair exonuclease SbcCD ATPase subunit
VEVLATQGAFSKVKLINGTEGWVSSSFLKTEKPAVAELDEMYKKYEETNKSLKQINEELSKKERELQVRRDELSNAKTTIRELKKQKAASGNTQVVDESELEEAQQKIKTLTQQLAEASAAQQKAEHEVEEVDDTNVVELKRENANLRARIESAQANLAGDTVPSPEQLAAIRPEFPLWYWGLLLLVLIVGVIGGLVWMDYKHRMRHGGFRI